MKKILVLVAVPFFILSAPAFAQYLTDTAVLYDSRYEPEFANGRGGAEGRSGAYVQIRAGIDNYDDLKTIDIKAKHMTEDFEVTLVEAPSDCVGTWAFPGVDQYFSTRLQPNNRWMKGQWQITLKYKTNTDFKGEENRIINVPRFNYPPEPTGIQRATDQSKEWLVWNSIGEPGSGPYRHVEYRVFHLTEPSACVDEFYVVRPNGNINYEMWSGNRIAVELPMHWQQGDFIRIENRVYDDNGGAVYRHDRGVRLFYLK